jgi:eukaryotic-like serine/threonine-protein kinase
MADLRERLQTGLADRYRIERQLGRGGMATVFLAHDLRHKRPVALKVLHPELAQTLGPERFQREIETVARLQHPHILTVYDSGETAGQLWFTMPYVEGESLRDRLSREKQLSVDEALRITHEAALALDYAHRHRVIHRDIKPENILLSDGQALVADFGIARALAGSSEKLTETGMAVGTPAYMSPEQASGARDLDARTDVYSLASVLYEMLAGEPPFTGATAQAVIAKRFSGEVPRVRHVRPSVPEHVEQVVTRALAPVAADRYATAAEFARALVTVGVSTPASTAAMAPSRAAPPTLPKGRRGVPVVALALGLGFLIGLGVLFAWRRSHHEGDSSGGGLKRLAVLPFENLGDSASEYFADGVTDAVRGKLAAIPSLQVTARSSSSQYKHTTKSPQVIGQELGAQYLLTGTVRWEKGAGGQDRVQVSPELVQVSTGSTKWQAPFDAALTDVFQVQADVAGRVADALNVTLGAAQRQTLAAKPTGSLPAYDAFLKGEEAAAHLTRFDAVSLQRALDFYERAVALDSTFVDAWMQLARAHALYYLFVTSTPAAATAAKQAADRAEALAPGSPAAALARGSYFALVQHDAAQALTVLQAGLQADPRNVDLLAAVAIQEREVGRLDSALALLQTAQALDPRSLTVPQAQALTLLWLRRYPEALAAAERALSLGPHDLQSISNKVDVHLMQGDLAGARAVLSAASAGVDPIDLATFLAVYADRVWALDSAQQHLLLRLRPNQGAFGNDRGTWGLVLAQIYYLRGDRSEAKIYADSARLAFEEQLRMTPRDPQIPSLLGLSLAYLGRRNDAIREGERGARLSPLRGSFLQGPYNQHQLARIYLVLGEPEQALDQLEPLLKIPSGLSPGWLKVDPNFAPLRGNPRFERLVKGT